jgi:hypothetical protein
MTIDVAAAETFVLTHGRLLERRRLRVLLHGEDSQTVLTTLAGYQNDDGGFGQALEPDVRGPHSETTATVTALELLEAHGTLGEPAAQQALHWLGTVARRDGGIPFMLPASEAFPHAPWMQTADEGSHLTFAVAAIAHRAGTDKPWVETAEDWCWRKLSVPDQIDGYLLKYALIFIDAHADDPRAPAALDALRPLVGPDGCVAVPGGTQDEKLTPLVLSPHPHLLSRSLFTDEHIQTDLARLAADQQSDGGWTFDWLEWCPAQGLDWRGVLTVQALSTLQEHGYR